MPQLVQPFPLSIAAALAFVALAAWRCAPGPSPATAAAATDVAPAAAALADLADAPPALAPDSPADLLVVYIPSTDTATDPPDPEFDVDTVSPEVVDLDAQAADLAVADVVQADLGSDATLAADLPPAPDIAAASNLHIHITTAKPFPNGSLLIKLANPSLLQTGQFNDAKDAVLYLGPMTGLTFDLYATAPGGNWLVLAMIMNGGGLFTGAVACAGGQAAIYTFGPGAPPLQSVTLQLAPMTKSPATSCSDIGFAPTVGVLTEIASLATPPTALGGAHFMDGLVWDQRFWVAGSQDGFVRFDFPAKASDPSPPMFDWTVLGDPFCNRLARAGDVLFCSSREGYLQRLQANPPLAKPPLTKVMVQGAVGTEGMAHRGNLLYIASHGAGLKAVAATVPHATQPLLSPPELTDVWDVRTLGSDLLVLANGMNGLAFLDVAANPLAPKLLGTLPLPGRAAFLHVQGDLVAVGALGGGLHLVDASVPSLPKLRGSLSLPGNVHGVTIHGGLVLAAAGHHVVAVDLPPPGPPAKLLVRAALPSKSFSLDVDAFGPDIASAEFLAVRRLQIDLGKPVGPVLLGPGSLVSPIAPSGQKLQASLRLHNAGSLPLHVTKIAFHDGGDTQWLLGPQAPLTPGPWTLAPGQSDALALTVTKTTKGSYKHQLTIHSDDPATPELGLVWSEVTDLQPGEPLPPLTYQDAGKKAWNLATHFQGKVGVLVVASQRCPVAFLAIAAAEVDLGPLLATGKVAAAVINPWDKPGAPETLLLKPPFPILYSPLTTQDDHDWSEVLQVLLGQEELWGPPMPIVYVVGMDGKIAFVQWGYESAVVVGMVKKVAGL